MNIQALLMDSCSVDKPVDDSPLAIKIEDHDSPNKSNLMSPQSLMFSRDNSKYWPHVSTASFSGNVFLPPTRPLASTDTSTTADSHSLSNFVDLSTDQNMICPLCKKVFRFEKNLLRHMQKTHATGEAESVLKCKLCNYTTRHYSNMYVHIRTHTGDKPYSCSGCGASFTQGSSLKLHIKSRHEDNTSLFSLTKKPGKNNLTKLWTRVYKKDLSKFSNYGIGNYFSPFNVANMSNHAPHDLLLPFGNFLSYPRIPQLPYIANCSPPFSSMNSSSHNLPMFLSRLPFLPPHFRSDNIDHSETLNSPDKSLPTNAQTFRNKKAILSISDFVNEDKPHSHLGPEDVDDGKSSDDEDSSSKNIDKPMTRNNQESMEKDEESNFEILSVVDFDVEETNEKPHALSDPINDFFKALLCNQNPQNFDQLMQILQSLGPSFIQKLKPFFPSNVQQKLSHLPLINGYPGLQQTDSKHKYHNNGLLPPCINRNNTNNPFSIPGRPPFHPLFNQTSTHAEMGTPWSDLIGKIGQLTSDKSLFHHQPPLSNPSMRTSMLPPPNMFGIVSYPPLMKMIDKASNQFLQ